ncbi:hypothetical protein BY458DRAFT_324149 [Sporodiniella umbellata]|nr:hypothetical protein BY458DRAFT_324149 [Sporodiniella umbellata]
MTNASFDGISFPQKKKKGKKGNSNTYIYIYISVLFHWGKIFNSQRKYKPIVFQPLLFLLLYEIKVMSISLGHPLLIQFLE